MKQNTFSTPKIPFTISGGNEGATLSITKLSEKNGVTYYSVKMELAEVAPPSPFWITWKIPCTDCYSVWRPTFNFERKLAANWGKQKTDSKLSNAMPVHCVLSNNGINRITVALSDAMTPVSLESGVCEEDANLDWKISFFTVPVAPLQSYEAILRIDQRAIPFHKSISEVASWWRTDCGYTPAPVPEHAKLPMNSLWYSYHQQLDVEDILKECRLSKPLGMDTVIIDDGWQTDDNSRGYAFCGDWQVATKKIPDMKDFVRRIHETGMKVILWYAVPFVGLYSKNYERFKTMLLDRTGNAKDFWALDPRYPEVRSFLIDVFTSAVSDWDLDGLKLDFIDDFCLYGSSKQYDARRDYESLEAAIDRLMTDITDSLRSQKEDILIEFRQSYVGPAICKYGNMLRVGDCPNDPLVNRKSIIDLRLTSGSTPVHSDMLMWNYDDTVESAALQLASVLYAVPQISLRIDRLNDTHKKMLAFYLRFWKKHRDLLLNGTLSANDPDSNYSQVKAELNGAAVVTAYTDRILNADGYSSFFAVNAAGSSDFVLSGAKGKQYIVYNCMGETVSASTVDSPLFALSIPSAGILALS